MIVRHWRPLAVISALVLILGTVALFLAGEAGVAAATILVLPVGVVGALFALAALFGPIREGSAEEVNWLRREAQQLADRMWQRDMSVLKDLLQALAAPGEDPNDFQFDTNCREWKPGELEPGDSVDDFTKSHRIVIVGAPGSGKTVRAIQLSRDLAVRAAASSAVDQAPVPVRANLSSFSPMLAKETLDDVTIETLSARMTQWLEKSICSEGVSRKAARRLIAEGLIIPVLDGLDEMDADDHRTAATAVIKVLNRHVSVTDGRQRVILTCRESTYNSLLERRAWVEGAHVVELSPLATSDVVDELKRVFDRNDSRWIQIISRLPEEGPLTDALRSPLRLYLLITSCRSGAGDPGRLLALKNSKEIDNELFAALIPTVTMDRSRAQSERAYRPADVHRWLTSLAVYLDHHGDQLHLGELWRVAGSRRAMRALCTIALVVLAIAIDSISYIVVPPDLQNPNMFRVQDDFIFLVAILALAGPATPLVRFAPSTIRQFALRRLALRITQGIALAAMVGAVAALSSAIVQSGDLGAEELAYIKVFALTGGTVGVLVGIDHEPPMPGLRHAVSQGFSYLAVLLLCSGLFGSAWYSLIRTDLARFGFLTGVVVGLGLVGLTPWPTYVAACLLQSLHAGRSRLPGRPAAFFEWARRAGLVRVTGPLLQLRHREFQDWLIDSESPLP